MIIFNNALYLYIFWQIIIKILKCQNWNQNDKNLFENEKNPEVNYQTKPWEYIPEELNNDNNKHTRYNKPEETNSDISKHTRHK